MTINRREFCASTGATVAAAELGLLGAAPNTSGIRSYRVNVPETRLSDMRRRIRATRWPERETVDNSSQGVQLATIQSLAQYWENGYDWRKIEARLNALPQYVTEIDGLNIYFIHVRSPHKNALPLVVMHGWPGSVIEQLGIIEPLTNPTAHGGTADDAFHVVIPSMPGYGFSQKPSAPGWDPARIARAWVTLMKRLGYGSFLAQGGDWGSVVANVMAEQAPPQLLGIHVNLPGAVPANIAKTLSCGEPAPATLTADEKLAFDQLKDFRAKHSGYFAFQATRPQTLYELADSPVALAAWMLDHDGTTYEQIAQAFAGQPVGGLTRDAVLDNITLYWLTNTGVSSARLYWEYHGKSAAAAVDVNIPAAVTVFPGEIYQAPRTWVEQAYHKLIYYNRVEKGAHFAAWEQPLLFSQEVRAGFRPLRKAAMGTS